MSLLWSDIEAGVLPLHVILEHVTFWYRPAHYAFCEPCKILDFWCMTPTAKSVLPQAEDMWEANGKSELAIVQVSNAESKGTASGERLYLCHHASMLIHQCWSMWDTSVTAFTKSYIKLQAHASAFGKMAFAKLISPWLHIQILWMNHCR